MMRKLGALAVIPVVSAAAAVADSKATDEQAKTVKKYKPQDLPIYTTIFDDGAKKAAPVQSEPSVVRSTIEGGVKAVRETCCDCVNGIKDKKKPLDEFVSTGIEHSQFAYDFLNQPANGIHRAGAIGVGAVAGYILAIRRGFFRRLIYTSAGGLGVASVCYPTEAEHYWHEAIQQSKVYATILYNFAYGVKPGDEPKPLPNVFPDNLKEAYGNAIKYFKSDSK